MDIWSNINRSDSVSRLVSAAASTNATLIKPRSGTLKKIIGYNAAAALRYIKLFDLAVAPTVGTSAIFATIAVAASGRFDIDFGNGLVFRTGIAYALTTGNADNDTGALTAADITGLSFVYY